MFSDNRSYGPKQAQGFTLMEIVVVLGLAGTIVALLYPSMMQNVGIQKKHAVFKETIQTVTQLLDSGISNDTFTGEPNLTNYMLTNLNGTVTCLNNAETDSPACWIPSIQGNYPWEVTEPGVILPNGAVVVGFNSLCGAPPYGTDTTPCVPTSTYNGFLIDWNGVQGPNKIGDDQLFLELCWGTNCGNNEASGTVVAEQTELTSWAGSGYVPNSAVSANLALYNWVMKPNN